MDPDKSSRSKLPLSATHPEVAASLVSGIDGDSVTHGSQKEATWRCSEGHTWRCTVYKRIRGGICPECVKESQKESLLVVKHPQLIKEIIPRPGDPDLNTLTYASNQRMLWGCGKGHRWESPVVRRTIGHGCPECAAASRVKTTALDARPYLADSFDEEASGFPLDGIGNASTRIAQWKCGKGHQWSGKIGALTAGKCPICNPRKARTSPKTSSPRGQNSEPKLRKGSIALSVSHPELAAEWDHGKNAPYTPDMISAGSNRKMWWICSQGHSWDAVVCNRTKYGCPICYGRRTLKGYNDILTTHPELADEFDAENSEYQLDEVSFGSEKKLAWKCSLGHQWISNPYSKKGCPICDGKVVLPGFNDLESRYPDISSQWDQERNTLSPNEVTAGSNKKQWWVCSRYTNHRWEATINDVAAGRSRCPECSAASHRSKGEKELEEFLQNIGVKEIKTSCRSLIKPLEVDIYLPEHKIAIEFNGVFWHSDKVISDTNYHYIKWKRCLESGVQLITIWEDDWRDRQDVIKSMIAHKLNLSDQSSVGARSCRLIELDTDSAREFMTENHIQGFSSGSVHIGLQHPDLGVVAVSSWRRNKNTLYLDRYATSVRVPGGMGRLTAAGKRWAAENSCTRLVTFSDHAVSDGLLYASTGWSVDGELKPDYSYLVNLTRVHKFNYRLSRFRNDPVLKYAEGMTERELAELNDLPRIWDCGKTRWMINLSDED